LAALTLIVFCDIFIFIFFFLFGVGVDPPLNRGQRHHLDFLATVAVLVSENEDTGYHGGC